MAYKECLFNGEPQEDIQKLVAQSLESGNAFIDDGKETWNKLMQQLLPVTSKIFALRGAGSWNGMDKDEIDSLLKDVLVPRIEEQLKNPGRVLIMHDGDYDDLEKPDLGYVAGRLLDHFENNVNRVVFLVAQKESWHPDDLKGRNLCNSHGLQYVTYLFPDNTYPDDHSSFTQDKDLVTSCKYEQWYIGASGKIASAQLTDYDQKVPNGNIRKTVLFRVANNKNLDQELQSKIAAVEKEGNKEYAESLKSRMEQRKRKYGFHWKNDGSPNIDIQEYQHLQLEFVF